MTRWEPNERILEHVHFSLAIGSMLYLSTLFSQWWLGFDVTAVYNLLYLVLGFGISLLLHSLHYKLKLKQEEVQQEE